LKPNAPVKLEDFIEVEKRKDWLLNKGMKVFSLYDSRSPPFILDVFAEIPFDFDEVYEKRKKIEFEGTVIPVVPIKELIEMKKKTDCLQERADVFYLKRIVQDWKDDLMKKEKGLFGVRWMMDNRQ